MRFSKTSRYQDPQKQAKIQACERQINQMVYQLYGLTEEEIVVVEGRVQNHGRRR